MIAKISAFLLERKAFLSSKVTIYVYFLHHSYFLANYYENTSRSSINFPPTEWTHYLFSGLFFQPLLSLLFRDLAVPSGFLIPSITSVVGVGFPQRLLSDTVFTFCVWKPRALLNAQKFYYHSNKSRKLTKTRMNIGVQEGRS